MRRTPLFVSWCLLLSTLVGGSAHGDAADRPNVIFFLSDDQRNDFLGCAGHPILKTPVIDRLAKRGVRFENAFVTTSICAASRATIFTGLWERTHKYTFGRPPIAEKFIGDSYPVLLRRAGYRTGFVGKFGVGVHRGATKGMFDDFVPLGRNPYFKKQPDGSLRHLTEITGDRAVKFLRSCSKDQPFCLSVSFNAAHAEDSDKQNQYPYPKAMDGLYAEVTIPPPLVSTDFWQKLPKFLRQSMHRDRWFWRWDTPQKYQKNVRAYYRMITGLDRVIGRVLDEAGKLGFGDNTVVIFSGDNGYYKGSRGFAGKWSHYEESLRVPLVIYDPRVPQDKRGRVVDNLVLNVDIPATIVALAKAKTPASYQGHSLLPLVYAQQPQSWRTDFFCEHLMDHPKIPKWEGVRGERYVYARYFEHLPEGEFLHDLKNDPKQLENLAGDAAHADLLAKMRRRCDQLRDKYGGAYNKQKFPTTRRHKSHTSIEPERDRPLTAGKKHQVTILRLDDRFRVLIDGALFTEYIYRGYAKPILYPIIGPHGIGMTRNYPMKKDVPGEAHDHVHHKSMWYAHRPINGFDFWSEYPDAGKTVQDKLIKIESGSNRGVIQTGNKWITRDGQIIFTDTRTLTFHVIAASRVIDWQVTIHASQGDVTFGDSKEGTMAIRTHPNLRLDNDPRHGVTTANGQALNSEGVRGKPVWGKRAKWIDYWGKIQGKTVGIAIFDHPANPRHPTWWMARGYGYVGANPFGIHAFEGKPQGTGDMTIKAGQEVTFRYRFVFHEGDPQQARIAERYRRYAQTGRAEPDERGSGRTCPGR